MTACASTVCARPAAWARIAGVLAAGAVAACVSAGASADGAPAQVGWRADERLLVTNFSELTALAVGPRHVFAAGPAGVISYDFTFERWEPPLTAAGGFPAHERITALAYDRGGDRLWLGTEGGSLYSTTLGFGRWERVTATGLAPVLEIVPFARDGALYIATAAGWLRLATGSFIAERVPADAVPPAVRVHASEARERSDPFLDAARSTLGLDPRLRRWRPADIEPGERPGEYWIATHGGGLLRYDTRFQRAEWLPFGLLSRGAGAIALDGDHIWFGGDGGGPRSGVVRADRALERWVQFEAGLAGAPAGEVAGIAAGARALWFAAADGLYRLNRADAERGSDAARWQRLTTRDGLPADAATAVVAMPAGAWAGTTRGLILVVEDGTAATEVLLPSVRINGLALARDTLWIATSRGLFIVSGATSVADAAAAVARRAPGAGRPIGQARIEPAPRSDAIGAPKGSIVDVAAGDAVIAVVEDGLHRWAAGEWSGPERGPLARLGRLGAVASEAGALWLAGENGLARQDARTGVWKYFLAPEDLPPGPVRGVAPAGEAVWVATAYGALRLDWRR